MFHLTVSLIVAASTFIEQAQPRPSDNTVSGVVLDPTGAVLPRARVEMKGPPSGSNQSTVTDDTGTFRLDRVSPGRYDILVTFEGFRPTTAHITLRARP